MQTIDGQLVFSASDIANFLECECIAALDRQHLEAPLERSEDSEAARLIQERGFAHETAVAEMLRRTHRSYVHIDSDSGDLASQVSATSAALHSGVEIICQATFKSGNYLGHADFSRRVSKPSNLGEYSYEVIDSKLASKTKAKFIIQLVFYSSLLAEEQGCEPKQMYVALGDGTEAAYQVSQYNRYFKSLSERFLDRIDNQEEKPYPLPCSHCDFCHWRVLCEAKRVADDHLCQVANITRSQMKKLQSAGVTTLADLAQLPPGSTVKKLAAATLEKLRNQARLQWQCRQTGKLLFEILPQEQGKRGFSRLPCPDAGDLFFDMEGDPFEAEGLEYLFGVSSYTESKEQFRAFWAHSRSEEQKAFEQVMDFFTSHLAAYPAAHIYHYGHYEETALKKLMCVHGIKEAEVDSLLRTGKLIDLYKVVREGVRISEPSYSIKNVEHFYRAQREGDVTDAAASIVFYEKWLETQDPQLLVSIEDYNHDDVRSTFELREWLLSLRPDGTPWSHEIMDTAQMPELGQMTDSELRLIPYREQLVDNLPDDRSLWTSADKICELVYHLLDFHRRADKPAWWAMFARQEMQEDELLEDSECLAGLRFDPEHPSYPDKRSHVYTCRFPEQETKLKSGDSAVCIETGGRAGDLFIDDENNITTFRYANNKPTIVPPFSLGPAGPVNTAKLREAVFRFADSLIAGDSSYAAIHAILGRQMPNVQGMRPGRPLIDETRESLPQIIEVVSNLKDSAIFIQGPPGSGKTYTGSHVIVALLKQGKRVGVSSNSHKAINNLLQAVETVALEQQVTFCGAKKSTSNRAETELAGEFIEDVFSNEAIESSHQLVAGTAWLFADETMDQQLDYLFVDEAGQVALANLIAMGVSAKNIVLLGDQMQLGQPIQGVHPGRSGESSLEYLLSGQQTIAPEQGIFLSRTWRLHPDICSFISDVVYDGRLQPELHNIKRRLILNKEAHELLAPSGIRYVPITHDSCSQRSQEEAGLILELINSLIKQRYSDKEGNEQPLGLENILVVAPYNMQVNLLTRTLPEGARVGTVDKFQGQEAEVVIISMATSSGDDLPRFISFLYSKNRLNVAISRAKCLAIIIANPALMSIKCKTPEEMALVNTLCWVKQYSEQ